MKIHAYERDLSTILTKAFIEFLNQESLHGIFDLI